MTLRTCCSAQIAESIARIVATFALIARYAKTARLISAGIVTDVVTAPKSAKAAVITAIFVLTSATIAVYASTAQIFALYAETIVANARTLAKVVVFAVNVRLFVTNVVPYANIAELSVTHVMFANTVMMMITIWNGSSSTIPTAEAVTSRDGLRIMKKAHS